MLEEQKKRLEVVFSPFTPLDPHEQEQEFHGRHRERATLQRVLQQQGLHLLLYGRRGIGKTSLGNTIGPLSGDGLRVKLSLDRSLTSFDAIWRALGHGLALALEEAPAAPLGGEEKRALLQKKVQQLLNRSEISIHALTLTLKHFPIPLLFVIDEFDLLLSGTKKEAVKTHFADLLKVFSDTVPQVKMFFIGIANSAEELIGAHPSLQRCLFQMELPQLEAAAVLDIIETRLRKVGLTLSETVKKKLLFFCDGSPYYAQLLTKFTAENALEMHYQTLTELNFNEGVKRVLENIPESVKKSCQEATAASTPQKKSVSRRAGKKPSTKQENYTLIAYAAALCTSNFHQAGALQLISSALEKQQEFFLEGAASRPESFTSKMLWPFLTSLQESSLFKRKFRAQSPVPKTPEESQRNFKLGAYLNHLCSKKRGSLLTKVTLRPVTHYCFTNPLTKSYLLFELQTKGFFSKQINQTYWK